mmetsp:Transcript_106874/g.189934  ORF Transcript_106874/g.189934 Transcript_106874/m.189934 type:complete len:153 (+) Transcript_106874:45-503(+)|eukprot:CAMPEP_0197661354 /NCGR_PEP_ID=MMETSP1338-20131121/51408_1 /TAXON_ID=43686 ORGANISM="Pelagodinium beii, Strain RCC1491" /NCGR_SAMPLE_ID=MMETSP1338 /ASSEMBLY_ACC=CAM_ASM_000754 /LENGTH=152 /DNA_ID=CAMNT_0043238895 /DNA_START=35 /DNA_END=493 /DNA_ORIENTATION=-
MSKDLLQGIFADGAEPLALQQTKKREVLPSFLDAGDGLFLPKGFDNDEAIKDYEEALQDMVANGGYANPGVSMIASGLAALYETKAAIDKDAKYYDRAGEYLSMIQQGMQAVQGTAAFSDPGYIMIEMRKAKLQRKKERRIAKGPAGRGVAG